MAPARRSKEIPNLDILRSLAVLLVLVDHVLQFFGVTHIGYADVAAIGVMGVYLFFVHTSLVLMLSLDRQRETRPAHMVPNFYIRRAFRIYPLSVVSVAAVALFAIPVARITGPGQFAGVPVSVGTLLSNLTLTMNLTGHPPMMGQLWSLPLEVQMYVFLPFLYLVARRTGPRAVVGMWVLAVVAALVLPRLWWRLSTATFAPCFIPGVLAYTLIQVKPRFPAWLWLPALLFLASLYLLVPDPGTAWVICLALGVAIPLFAQIKNRVVTTAGHYIAKYSYGIYLGHLFCIWLAFVVFKGPFGAQVALLVASLVIIPVLAYHAIEAPMIKVGIRFADKISGSRQRGSHPHRSLSHAESQRQVEQESKTAQG